MSKTNNETLDSYNKRVLEYVKTSPQKVGDQLGVWIDKILSKLNTNARILEIGSGSGKDDDYFKSKGFHMELTDGSQGFVDYLISKGKQARLLNILTDELGDCYQLVFADAVFLHFTSEELKAILSKIYKSLIDRGTVAFTLKAGNGEEITERKIDARRYFRYWSADLIRDLLKNIGYENIQIYTIGDYRGEAKMDWLLISADKM